jgi:hypothetical protein
MVSSPQKAGDPGPKSPRPHNPIAAANLESAHHALGLEDQWSVGTSSPDH